MLIVKRARRTGLTAITALILTSIGGPAAAQLRPPVVAPGFEMNLFASPANVPEFALGLTNGPVALAFDRRGRLFVATYSGKILILLDNDDDGVVDQVKRFGSLPPFGPLGLEFSQNGDLYATSNIFGGAGRIMRLRDADGDDVAEDTTIIVDNLPSGGDHQTGRLKFGPDGMLYFGQGSSTDDGEPERPGQPPEGPLNATILRIDVDNPLVDIFATGVRNPFGMAFHPETGALFATDVQAGELCQFGNCPEDTSVPDEVNWIIAGGNYGFPECPGTPTLDDPGCAGVRPPMKQYLRHLTPTALTFYTGPQAGEFTNQLLITIYKNLPNIENIGGDLRRLRLEFDPVNGYMVRQDESVVLFDPIDPFDGPVEIAIEPISGDIYVARFDPVQHGGIHKDEHHHFIYRIHREGSDLLPFIGPPAPSSVVEGSGPLTIRLMGRHLKPGAVVIASGSPVPARPGADRFELLADLPASMTSSARMIEVQVENPGGSRSNIQSFTVTADPNPPGPPPQLNSLLVYKKKRSRVVSPVVAGSSAKKLRLLVMGAEFDASAQLLVNGTAVEIVSSSSTEIVGRLTNQMLANPGDFPVQVRNATGRLSNILRLMVVP